MMLVAKAKKTKLRSRISAGHPHAEDLSIEIFGALEVPDVANYMAENVLTEHQHRTPYIFLDTPLP